MYEGYLPISKQDMIDRGIEQLDFVYVCGDAYVDHPSFGHAIIARLLEAHGYSVGIISQPDWKAWISCVSRKYGFHGKPLFRFQKEKKFRFVYTRWCYGKTPGLCDGGLLQSDSPYV